MFSSIPVYPRKPILAITQPQLLIIKLNWIYRVDISTLASIDWHKLGDVSRGVIETQHGTQRQMARGSYFTFCPLLTLYFTCQFLRCKQVFVGDQFRQHLYIMFSCPTPSRCQWVVGYSVKKILAKKSLK